METKFQGDATFTSKVTGCQVNASENPFLQTGSHICFLNKVTVDVICSRILKTTHLVYTTVNSAQFMSRSVV